MLKKLMLAHKTPGIRSGSSLMMFDCWRTLKTPNVNTHRWINNTGMNPTISTRIFIVTEQWWWINRPNSKASFGDVNRNHSRRDIGAVTMFPGEQYSWYLLAALEPPNFTASCSSSSRDLMVQKQPVSFLAGTTEETCGTVGTLWCELMKINCQHQTGNQLIPISMS